MKKLTNKRFVEYVVKFMRKQGAPAFDAFENCCVNTTGDGKRCALACCFTNPDKFTNGALGDTLVQMGVDYPVVVAVRSVHDRCALNQEQNFVEVFETALRTLPTTSKYMVGL